MFAEDSVFVDTETTGVNAGRDRITEIAIITVEQGKVVSEWSSLVNPQMPIPDYIQSFTGISNEMVRDAPTFAMLCEEVLGRLEGNVFVAHNARFDYGFLKNEFRRCGVHYRSPVLCTVKLSRSLFPQYRRHNLDSIMERHGIRCDSRHRALGDARVLLEFLHSVYNTLEHPLIEETIARQLKRPSLPVNLSEADIEQLPQSPGVYLFRDTGGVLLYAGKSINIRERVLSHFSSDHRNNRDMKISRNVAAIDCIETAGELGALLMEAKIIKEQLPVYNRRLRHYDSLATIRWDGSDRNSMPVIITSDNLETGDIANYYGLFKTTRQARNTLRQLARDNELCEKTLGMEKGDGPCFAYQLKRCRGACVGAESAIQHQMRFMQAMSPLRNRPWPYAGCIGIREDAADNHRTDIHVFDHWCYLGTVHTEYDLLQGDLFNGDRMFDLDTYRILLAYFRKNRHTNIIHFQPEGRFTTEA